MLKELRLAHIVLVESAVIHFTPGLNILSGESGSGKSAIMNALNLIAGERSDSAVIRRGAEKGTVEAYFELNESSPLHQHLEQWGIDHESGSELILRRDISIAGKSRAFINNQAVQLAILRQASEYLFHVIGQHANQKLLSLDTHRMTLDTFGGITNKVEAFGFSWQKENKTRAAMEALIQSESQRLRDIEVCLSEIEELQSAHLREGEEESLFEEYTQLSNAEEIAQKAGDLTEMLSGEKLAVLSQLSRQRNTFEQLVRLSPQLESSYVAFNAALIELQEISHTLSAFTSRIEHNPQQAEALNERLKLIAKLKRKYGPSLQEALEYLERSKARLEILQNADACIETLSIEIKELEIKNNALCKEITTLRQEAALRFQKEVKKHLHALNMPKAEFSIEMANQKRSLYGDDRIEFFLTPNVGEHQVSLRECASGGELSRTMLAIQAVLSGKEAIPTLIFDEIDANIGGETATVVGQKLEDISRFHQILCITHFPQVAKFGVHHLRISKKETDGRTITIVDILNQEMRSQELARMSGGALR